MTDPDALRPGARFPLGFAMVVSVVLLVVSGIVVPLTTTQIGVVWVIGAAVLGLLSGFTTGASKETGAGSELLKFVSGAIVTPLLGSVVSLTSPASPALTPAIHPLWALGAFFAAFSAATVLGVLCGILLRKAGIEIRTQRGF